MDATQKIKALESQLAIARDTLRYYAEGHHFTLHEPTAWDTVSGEPANFQEDEACTATVEDGSVAKMALEKLTVLPSPMQDEAAKLAPILRGMVEGGGEEEGVDIYADDYSPGDGDVFVIRAAELLEAISR